MQREWRLEVRMSFLDKGKNDVIDYTMKVMAARINATIALLADGQKPEVRCWSDDFFTSPKELEYLGSDLGVDPAVYSPRQEEVSDEMLEALKEMQHDA